MCPAFYEISTIMIITPIWTMIGQYVISIYDCAHFKVCSLGNCYDGQANIFKDIYDDFI
jgi:hypothetical protein